jgi:hypothetical protein
MAIKHLVTSNSSRMGLLYPYEFHMRYVADLWRHNYQPTSRYNSPTRTTSTRVPFLWFLMFSGPQHCSPHGMLPSIPIEIRTNLVPSILSFKVQVALPLPLARIGVCHTYRQTRFCSADGQIGDEILSHSMKVACIRWQLMMMLRYVRRYHLVPKAN